MVRHRQNATTRAVTTEIITAAQKGRDQSENQQKFRIRNNRLFKENFFTLRI